MSFNAECDRLCRSRSTMPPGLQLQRRGSVYNQRQPKRLHLDRGLFLACASSDFPELHLPPRRVHALLPLFRHQPLVELVLPIPRPHWPNLHCSNNSHGHRSLPRSGLCYWLQCRADHAFSYGSSLSDLHRRPSQPFEWSYCRALFAGCVRDGLFAAGLRASRAFSIVPSVLSFPFPLARQIVPLITAQNFFFSSIYH